MDRLNLTVSNPREILFLLEELCGLPFTEVQQRINKYIQSATSTQLSFLVPVLIETEELVIHVVGDKILDRELKFSVANTVLHDVIKTRKVTMADTRKLEEEILGHLREVISPVPNALLLIPINHARERNTSLLVCLADNNMKSDIIEVCVKLVEECFRFCLGFLLNSLRSYEENRLKRQCQELLAVSRKLITSLGDFSDLLRDIMSEARRLTHSERCSLFLLDPDQEDLVAKVFDGLAMDKPIQEMRIPIGQGIAGHVATTGELLNIKNAYEHPLFYRRIDDLTGFKTRNILCFPIRDEKGIVGVAQLCNKLDGLDFDIFDEEIATAFSIYCGITIMHGIMYKKVKDAQARSKLCNEVMMYHLKIDEDMVQGLLNCKDSHNIRHFDNFRFSPKSVPISHMPCYAMKMFNELGLVEHWKIKAVTLARFILYVQKGYRNAPYHNWYHAFSVTHFAYLLIKNLNLIAENYMTYLEALVFLVSCICHDVDHRGTNNSFQTKSSTVLACLYSSDGSVMERHHLAQAMCILNTEGCNVFESFNGDEYSLALDLLGNNILATDLSSHFRTAKQQHVMMHSGFDKNDPKQRKLFFSMLMTCCDVSDQTKHWRVSKKTAENIYDEFFSQGDMEKSMGTAPIEMMDREKASIPDLQIQFITRIVLPLFTDAAIIFPTLKPLVSVLEENRTLWETAKVIFDKYGEEGMSGMEILLDPTFEEEVLRLHYGSDEFSILSIDTLKKESIM